MEMPQLIHIVCSTDIALLKMVRRRCSDSNLARSAQNFLAKQKFMAKRQKDLEID